MLDYREMFGSMPVTRRDGVVLSSGRHFVGPQMESFEGNIWLAIAYQPM